MQMQTTVCFVATQAWPAIHFAAFKESLENNYQVVIYATE